ncbi:sugar/nucleoside kinase (ribokinase family) [Haloactinopolyspora alba]|uniref:Sugar/nucleoside kinase (Ribokinase family) n=1 Tax=Haloactinopolyspora alba TaxID=648780 RepID=A0A2P8EBL8_9ACTN|nr:PfkB family carbohydrate kinase [Haloactinopolyspora alba]PSL06865.1 sugar/nucleoside kinase (ribokinase family) [Haloactinopolyspora alba]
MSNVARDPHRASAPRHDPLADSRPADAPDLDVFLTGTVFFDIVFIGLDDAPKQGTEVWASGMGSSPGGVANLAVACARLGMRTGLAATFGEDLYGDYCRQTLGIQEGVDLTHSRYVTGWHSPVTVSMVYERDRAMVTHGHQPEALSQLVAQPPRARSCFVDLAADRQEWVEGVASSGGLVFADLGWDPEDRWDIARLRESLQGCHAFSPNALEAMSYTRTDTPEAALEVLADLVPLAVVTNGGEGALAFDKSSGRPVHAPAVPVDALDPTGAGDVFVAGLMVGTLAEWPLEHSLRLANLGAALSVRHFGGALASPGWGDIALWYRDTGSKDPGLAGEYEFLDTVLPDDAVPEVSRAIATLGFRAGR